MPTFSHLLRRVLAVAAAALCAASIARGQSASDSLTVTAANVTSFSFSINSATFDFGTVSPAGTVSSTGVAGVRRAANDGATYTGVAATWTCRSSGLRLVRIFNASAVSSIGWGNASRLAMRIPATGLPWPASSCGYKTFPTIGDSGVFGCGAGNLLRLLLVGSGANQRTGNLDLQLTVLDTDVPGVNSWTVVLTAATQ